MLKSIRAQIALLAIIPLIAFAVAGGLAVNEALIESRKASEILPVALMAERSEAVIHELQKERGRTAVMLASGYAAKPRELLNAQRRATDLAVADMQQAAADFDIGNHMLVDQVSKISNGLDEIAAHRAGVDSRSVSGAANLKFYSGEVRKLIMILNSAVQASPDTKYAQDMGPFLLLTEAIEAGGLERAIGGQLFAIVARDGVVPANRFLAYYDRLAVETAFLNNFETQATPQQIADFDQIVSGPDVDQVMEWRQVLRTLPETVDGQGIEGSVWFGKATQRLNLIRAASLDMLKAGEVRAAQLAQEAGSHLLTVLVETVLVVLVTIALCVWQIRRVTSLFGRLTASLVRIAEGDTDFAMPFGERKDAIGDLARAGEVFQENARMRGALETDAARERDRERMRQNHVEDLIEKFRVLMVDVTNEVDGKTSQMTEIASRVRSISNDASGAATQAKEASQSSSSNVQTVAAAAEQMSAAIREILGQAGRAGEVIEEANGVASQTDRNVSSLADAVEKIGEVVEMIRAIAEQTNLLALNATIEAARAGEAGKGFAVVAAEVKELSTQTAKATEEISNQIASVQDLTNEAVGSIRKISGSIELISDVTGAITAAVGEQSAATQEISQSITVAASETGNAVASAETVDQAIHATAGEAETVDQIAGAVKEVANRMAEGIEGFLGEMADDVDERRRANRKQEQGQPVVLITAEGQRIETRLMNSSDGGIGVMTFPGAQEGAQVVHEDSLGNQVSMVVRWLQDDTVGLQYLAGEKTLSEAA